MKESKAIVRDIEANLSIEEKVRFLKEPQSYPNQKAKKVEAKETHMSWVFLVGDVAYKLKKPVVNFLFDFRALDARLKNCQEEVRLNMALAGEIYLGVEPIVINEMGKLQLAGRGKIVDWLVKMKRIPEMDLLDYAIVHNCIHEAKLRSVARLLAEFYFTSSRALTHPSQHIEKLEAAIFFNYNQLSLPQFELSHVLLDELTAGQLAFLNANNSLFSDRVRQNKIIEAHGDLRPEHICLGPSPVIIDRLEFNRELRIMDVAEELSFLSLECEMMGNKGAGDLFWDEYVTIANDSVPPALIIFYKIKRACLRAYLVARHKEETRYKNDPKWMSKAKSYLELAETYHQRLLT